MDHSHPPPALLSHPSSRTNLGAYSLHQQEPRTLTPCFTCHESHNCPQGFLAALLASEDREWVRMDHSHPPPAPLSHPSSRTNLGAYSLHQQEPRTLTPCFTCHESHNCPQGFLAALLASEDREWVRMDHSHPPPAPLSHPSSRTNLGAYLPRQESITLAHAGSHNGCLLLPITPPPPRPPARAAARAASRRRCPPPPHSHPRTLHAGANSGS